MTKTIRSFKLITAEEIITYAEEKDDHFLITDTRVCLVTGCNPNTNEIQSALIPFMNTGSHCQPAKLYKSGIVAEVETDLDIEKSFLGQISPIELI